MKKKRYYYTTKAFVTSEVIVEADSEEEAYDLLMSGQGKETEVNYDCYSEDLEHSEDITDG
tara:strand:- start:13 stop:195 length:183 start_codon:yes stop_codon:yes gene_type:complete